MLCFFMTESNVACVFHFLFSVYFYVCQHTVENFYKCVATQDSCELNLSRYVMQAEFSSPKGSDFDIFTFSCDLKATTSTSHE